MSYSECMDRVLTVKNPYASAIFAGKDIENRSFAPTWRGTLWVHAGLSIARDAVLPDDELQDADWNELPRGVVLGSVQLVDVVTDSDSPWAIPGYYHWVLADPEPIVPFRFTGALGLRRFDASALLALAV